MPKLDRTLPALLGAAAYGALLAAAPAGATGAPDGPVLLINRTSGMCALAGDASAPPGTQLEQGTCTGVDGDLWTLTSATDGYRIESAATGQCLDVANSSKQSQVPVVRSPCDGRRSQVWTLRPVDGAHQIVSRHSGKCLNVPDRSRNEGAGLRQFNCLGDGPNDRHDKWNVSPSTLPSAWGEKVALPLIPVAAANLADGRVLFWSARDRLGYGGDAGRTYTGIFDPKTGASTEKVVSNTNHDMFCPGTTVLADGRILVNGGSSSSKTTIFDPAKGPSGGWVGSDAMNIARGYQSNTLLPNGDVFTVGGSWSGGIGGKDGEVWREGAGWRHLPGVPASAFPATDPQGEYRTDNHFWLFAAADGWVFHAGPSAEMNWIDTNGDGRVVPAGTRGNDPYSINGNAVLVDAAAGKILTVGGAGAYKGYVNTTGSARYPGSEAAHVIDISGGPSAPVRVRKVAPMAFPRVFHSSVLLPNGQVVVVGGQNVPRAFTDERPVMFPELWDPATETFARLAPMATPRTYHSAAVLMMDGRVFVGGGGLCGNKCPDPASNHPDAEILTPPYLLNADGTPAARPAITAAPTRAAPGATVTVTTDAPVASFALVRTGAATHTVNTDQRRVVLTPSSADGTSYRLPLPADTGVLLPGTYMLFAMDERGVPSVAKALRVRP